MAYVVRRSTEGLVQELKNELSQNLCNMGHYEDEFEYGNDKALHKQLTRWLFNEVLREKDNEAKMVRPKRKLQRAKRPASKKDR